MSFGAINGLCICIFGGYSAQANRINTNTNPDGNMANQSAIILDLPSYLALVRVELIHATPDGKRVAHTLTGEVAAQLPGKLRVRVLDERGGLRALVVADGKSLWTVRGSGNKSVYRQEALRAEGGAGALTRGGLIGPEFAGAILGEDPLEKFQAMPGVRVARVPTANNQPRMMDGVPVEVFTVAFPGPVNSAPTIPGGRAGGNTPKPTSVGKAGTVVTLVYGAQDRRLRRVIREERQPNGEVVRRVEGHRDIRVGANLPASLFTFAPPAGAVAAAPAPQPANTLAPVSSVALDAPMTGGSDEGPVYFANQPRSARPGAVAPVTGVAGGNETRGSSSGAAAVPGTVNSVRFGVPFATANRPGSTVPANTAATVAVASAPPPAVTGRASLSVTPAGGVTLADSASAKATFAGATLLDKTYVDQTFTLKNTGSVPATVTRLVSSCGCLSALVGEGGRASLPVTLAPGQTLEVRARVSFLGLHPGSLSKTISVYTADAPDVPTLSLTLQGTLLPVARIAPATLDLGRAEPGAGGVTVTITPDPRLKNGPVPTLQATHPGLVVTPLPRQGDTLRYRVSVAADAPLGPLTGQLAFAPDPAADPDAQIRAAAWRSVTVPVTGEVIGDVSAAPGMVAFGAVSNPPAQGVSQTVTLTAIKPNALRGATVTVTSPYLRARLRTDIGTAKETALEITLLPGAPSGVLQATVIVQLANRQRLSLPVNAYVTAASSGQKANSPGQR